MKPSPATDSIRKGVYNTEVKVDLVDDPIVGPQYRVEILHAPNGAYSLRENLARMFGRKMTSKSLVDNAVLSEQLTIKHGKPVYDDSYDSFKLVAWLEADRPLYGTMAPKFLDWVKTLDK